jgi:ethanolamine utilization protein EutN
MRIAKVIGNAYATLKHEKLKSIKLMVIQPINPDGDFKGKAIIVADYLNTAIGNIVYWIEDGSTICKATGERSIPLRGCILGIIDSIDMKNEGKILVG